MAIGRLRRAGRFLTRYREIFSVLVRYGLADWAHRIDLDFAREIITRNASPELLELNTEERVRRALMDLGPTFIKFGQILSVRPDLVGVELSDELKELQSNVEPDPAETVAALLEEELGKKTDEVFRDFEYTPVASASIGQVHRGWLASGEKVAVKVRHADIERIVETDLEILADLAGLLQDYVEEARYYRPKETVEQFSRTIRKEMDFNREARHIANLRDDLADDETVRIPMVFEEHTTSKILVMEWVEGKALNTVIEDKSVPEERMEEIAMMGAALFLKMIFVNGFYHADPHPGNLMICDDGKIGLLDFGMVGRLSERMRESIEDLVAAVVTQNSDKLARIIIRVGQVPHDMDETALGSDVHDFISFYANQPMMKIKLFEGLNEMVTIIHRHHIVLPVEITMLIKTLVTLEGSGRTLHPDFKLISLVEPYREQMSLMNLSIKRRVNRMSRMYDELTTFAETVPPALVDIIERFRQGALEIHMDHRGLEHSVNRLVFGIITAALFLGSSLLLSFKAPPVLFGYSALGVIGYIVAIIMGLRILWAIMISTKLE